MEEKSTCKVCVTGGAGYIGSSLVKKLLDKGYIVHATLRNLEDESKVGLLKSLSGADERLKLFEADIYRAEEFEEAIQGCEFVFHVATPLLHYEGSQYKDRTEATVDGVKKIGRVWLKSGTVKRLTYTASIVAASPLKEDGITFKQLMDETRWTPLNFSNPYNQPWLWVNLINDYVESKMLAEKEVLKFEKEVFTQEEKLCNILKFLEELNGKVPVVHIEDVCEAHMFFMNNAGSLNGRFLCASSFVSTAEIGTYYQHNYPEFKVNQEYLNDPKREIKWGSKKLIEKGFVYKYGMKELLDDCVKSARKNGIL
ncbi:hypothetical protein R3W88_026491 [Solanum pinnatisectum]|uniref:NAD-dependent epimerase/dehydratase domain-containing protein n=1 Tax=Solanum pinnatisectum TaxID=50273 RepID=A0AAV9LDH9_9SOLN|nr:hypothetical protein R3W88_026491 [Solanum pinnatisectum]